MIVANNTKAELDADDRMMTDAIAARKAANAASKKKIMQKPAAATPSTGLMKRPSAAGGATATVTCRVIPTGSRPAAPLGSEEDPPPRVMYRGSYIHTTWSKRCYTVRHPTRKIHTTCKWGDNHAAAWVKALKYLDDKDTPGRK